MKTTALFSFVLATLFISTLASAAIQNSDLELRHQALIESQIAEQCGFVGQVKQHSHDVVETMDDQKPFYSFTTRLVVSVRQDNMVFDEIPVTVKSSMSSGYDHNAKEWGLYSVDQVICQYSN